jgi:hypothetical protein
VKLEDKILEQVDAIKKYCERYLHSVFLTIGIKNFVETKKELSLKFISSEKKMKNPDTTKVVGTPDIVLQYTHTEEGILIELKVSAPIAAFYFDYFLAEVLEQLQKYDKKLIGWETSSGTVNNHSIVLLVDHEDSKKVRNAVKQAIEREKLEFQNTLSFWEWVLEPSVKFGKKEVITVRDLDDGIIGNKLGNYLRENDIIIELEKINKTYDKRKYMFIRKKPQHIYYVIDILFSIIFPALGFDEKGHLITNTNNIMKLAEDNFPTWLPESGTKTQLKISWLKEALTTLEEINLAERKGSSYEIRLPRENNVKKYIIERLAKLDIEKHRYSKQKLEREPQLKTLYDF